MTQVSLLNELVNTFDADTDSVTVEAPVNIAITKYWGKHDADLNIPLNDSISITIDMQSMCTKTVITVNRNQNKDYKNNNKNSISLNNGAATSFNSRINNLISAINQYLERKNASNNILNDIITIKSINNFPTAAGLASSASGYAALAKGLCVLYGINDDKIQTIIARHGSGSASRSLHGGFVKWFASNPSNPSNPSDPSKSEESKTDAFDSYAQQLFDEKYWSDLKVIICVASSKEKDIGSSIGQILSAKTSQLLPQRLKNVAKRDKLLQKAIKERDFDSFAYISMKDSSEFHAICLDTFPPIFYLNDASKAVIKICHLMNNWYHKHNKDNNQYMVSYTFDAGPNAVLVLRNDECLNIMMKVIKNTFFNANNNHNTWIEDKLNLWNNDDISFDINYPEMQCDGLEKIIVTKIGIGAQIIE